MHVLALLPPWTWHPLGQCAGTVAEVNRCKSYNAWSGIVSDISEVTLVFALLGIAWRAYRLWRAHTECHVEGCSRHGHPVHGTAYRACHPHHPAVAHMPGEPVTAVRIADAHAKHLAGARSSGP